MSSATTITTTWETLAISRPEPRIGGLNSQELAALTSYTAAVDQKGRQIRDEDGNPYIRQDLIAWEKLPPYIRAFCWDAATEYNAFVLLNMVNAFGGMDTLRRLQEIDAFLRKHYAKEQEKACDIGLAAPQPDQRQPRRSDDLGGLIAKSPPGLAPARGFGPAPRTAGRDPALQR